ncbi:MAG: hypothetical protein ACRDQB_10310 [Thermocrispum sp.]
MIRRALDDPWRVFQLYAAVLAVLVVIAAAQHLAAAADEWTTDGRPIVHVERQPSAR